MMITPYQIIVPLVALVAIVYVWNLVMRRRKTVWEAILWCVFWGTIAYIAIDPNSIEYITIATGIQDRESAVLSTFLGILFFIVFYMVMRLEALEQRQTRLVRKMALKDLKVGQEKDV